MYASSRDGRFPEASPAEVHRHSRHWLQCSSTAQMECRNSSNIDHHFSCCSSGFHSNAPCRLAADECLRTFFEWDSVTVDGGQR